MSDRQKTDHVNKSYTLYQDDNAQMRGGRNPKTLVRKGSKYDADAQKGMAETAQTLAPRVKDEQSLKSVTSVVEMMGGVSAASRAKVNAEKMKK